jgi:Na+/citrate or Na+/malate symporter
MMQTSKYLAAPFFIGGLSALLLAGCATSLGDKITIPVGEGAMYEAMPKEKSIAHLEKNILEAKKQGMPFLAPHYFREASDIFNRAVSSPDKVPTATCQGGCSYRQGSGGQRNCKKNLCQRT